ncbi:MAG TPA: hypothetical protein VFZ63_15060 [Jiangellaceae bacterium]
MDVVSWVGGIAAIVAAATLLVGAAGMAPRKHRARPWLVVLFEINAGRRDVSRQTLRGVEPVDVVLLLVAGAAYPGFWPGPGANHLVWMTLAIAQPLLGIPLLLATRLFGRSGLMGGALVLSILVLVDGTWTATGWLGVTASLLLLVGDFGTTGRPSRLLAVLLAVGYGALVAWFGWIAVLLLA